MYLVFVSVYTDIQMNSWNQNDQERLWVIPRDAYDQCASIYSKYIIMTVVSPLGKRASVHSQSWKQMSGLRLDFASKETALWHAHHAVKPKQARSGASEYRCRPGGSGDALSYCMCTCKELLCVIW